MIYFLAFQKSLQNITCVTLHRHYLSKAMRKRHLSQIRKAGLSTSLRSYTQYSCVDVAPYFVGDTLKKVGGPSIDCSLFHLFIP